MFNVAPSLIRYWLGYFNIEVKKNRKGNRQFTAEDVAIIKKLHSLIKKQGRTLEGVRDNFITIDPRGKSHLYMERNQTELWALALAEQNMEERIRKFVIHKR